MASKRTSRTRGSNADHPSIVELASAGGDLAETLLRRITRSLTRSAPEMAADLKDEVKAARAAARSGDVDGSLHRIAGLAEEMLEGGLLELAAVLCGVGANVAGTMSDDEPTVLSGRSNLRNAAGLIAMRLGNHPEATQCFEEARSLALAADDQSLLAAVSLNLSNIARVSGNPTRAARYAHDALNLYEAQGDQRGQIQLLQTLGSIAVEAGDVDRAEDWVTRASSILREHRDPGLTSGNHHLRGRIYVLRGELDSAESSLRLAVDAARRANDSDKLVAALQSWSAVAADADRPAVARRRLISAVSLAEQEHLRWRLHALLPSLIRLHIRTGHKTDARSAAARLLEVARDAGTGVGEAEALLGAALIDDGLLDPGLEHLETAWESLTASLGEDAKLREHTLHNLVVGHSLNGTLHENAQALTQRARALPKDSAAEALEQLGLYLASEIGAAEPKTKGAEHVEEILLESLSLRSTRRRAWPSLLMASHLEQTNQPSVAVPVLRVGLAAARRSAQETLIRRVRNDLGLALVQVGDYPAGLRLFEQNIQAAMADDDLQTIRLAHFNCSETYRRLGQAKQAEAAAREALRIAEVSGDRDDLNEARIQMALTLMDQDRLDDAGPLLRQVVDSAASPDSQAAALSSLGSIALGQQRPDEAADLYRQALKEGERHPKGKAETLLGLCEALATTSSRRPYTRTLQRVIDALALVPYDVDLASRFLRCAMRWHENAKDIYAAESLAVAILVGAAQLEDGQPPLDEDSPLLVGLGVAAGALGPEGPFTDDAAFIKLLEDQLTENVSRQSAQALMKALKDFLD